MASIAKRERNVNRPWEVRITHNPWGRYYINLYRGPGYPDHYSVDAAVRETRFTARLVARRMLRRARRGAYDARPPYQEVIR